MSRKITPTRIISSISIIFFLISFCSTLSAQEKPEGQKVLIGGKTYTLYKAVSGDTQFSIARRFGITLDELNGANPEIKDKLNSGQTVKIPLIESKTKPQNGSAMQNGDNDDRLFSYHSVRRKETVFSIAQKSNINPEEIYRFNPKSKDGIKEGDVLKIPKVQASANQAKADKVEIQQPIKHIVRRKETLFSIAREYKTTQEEILKSNPTLKGALSKGTVLIIPGNSPLPPVPEKPNASLKFSEYRIVNGDNYYQLEKRFSISKAELEQLNPTLKEGFNAGMIIRIPLKISIDEATNNSSESQQNSKSKQVKNPSVNSSELSFSDLTKTYEIGVFLPFCQNLNDSAKIAQRTASFLEFYSGLLLATEKITEAGMKVKLYTYDTYMDNKVVERIVKKPEFLSLDLIIGPVYPENQKIVAELSAKNRIPMISPLSSDGRLVSSTPGYYQINPEKKIRLSGTVDYIADKFVGQNIIVLNQGTNSKDVNFILDRLNQKLGAGKYRKYNIMAEGTAGLEAMLKTDKKNIIVLAEGSEANVSVAMTRLNTISKSNKITVIGIQEYTKMQSIDIEYLHNTRLHYLAPYFVDYANPKVKTFIEKYRTAYSSEPTQYSFQGYDIALHFLATLAMAGKNFPETNPSPGIDLLQADYSFQKPSEFGGYINQTLYIIEYTDTYEVHSAGKIKVTVLKDKGEVNDKNNLD